VEITGALFVHDTSQCDTSDYQYNHKMSPDKNKFRKTEHLTKHVKKSSQHWEGIPCLAINKQAQ